MKKVIYAMAIAALVATGFSVKAQDCKDIVLPHVNYNMVKLSNMSEAKIAWYCTFSKNSFFLTNEVPTGAKVYNICDLTFKRTGEHPKDNFQVDLTKLSYYAYNFDEFQYQNYHSTIYFHTPHSTYKYLGVYSIGDTFKRTDAEVKNKD